MSEKDRAKKDHQRTEKKNKQMRERENPQTVGALPRNQAKDQSDLTEETIDDEQES
jgi:hypothetical protein